MVAYAETRRAARCPLGLSARRGVSVRNGYWDANAGDPPGSAPAFVDDPQPYPHVMCDYTYLKDHMGNVLALVDSASDQAQLQTFDAFGNRIGANIPFQCASDHDNRDLWTTPPQPAQPIARMQTGSMGWRGGEGSMTDLNGVDRSEDPDGGGPAPATVVQPTYTGASTGLIYMRARYYEPQTGRFIQPDPVPYGPELLLAGQNNRWAYCANDPVNCSDPSGLIPIGLVAIVGFYVGFVGGEMAALFGFDILDIFFLVLSMVLSVIPGCAAAGFALGADIADILRNGVTLFELLTFLSSVLLLIAGLAGVLSARAAVDPVFAEQLGYLLGFISAFVRFASASTTRDDNGVDSPDLFSSTLVAKRGSGGRNRDRIECAAGRVLEMSFLTRVRC